MGLEKAIEHGKEKRKPYRGAKSIDHQCRNHGECPYCNGNRLYSSKKRKAAEQDRLNEWKGETTMMWDVLGASYGEFEVIRSFYDYQEAVGFAASLDWYYVDMEGRGWDLSVEEAV